MLRTGDEPGAGIYICRRCGYAVRLDNGKPLPMCPICAASITGDPYIPEEIPAYNSPESGQA